MTFTEKWTKVTELQAQIRALDARRDELCRELNRTLMAHTPAEPRRRKITPVPKSVTDAVQKAPVR